MTTAILLTKLKGLGLDVIHQLIIIPLTCQNTLLPLFKLKSFELKILLMVTETILTSLHNAYLLIIQ